MEDMQNEEVAKAAPSCTDDPSAAMPATAPYALLGQQVEPAATYWLVGKSLPHVVPIENIVKKFQDAQGKWKPEILFPVDNKTIKAEIAELKTFAAGRGKKLKSKALEGLSDFLNLQKRVLS